MKKDEIEWRTPKKKEDKPAMPKTFELEFLMEFGKKPKVADAEAYAEFMRIKVWQIEGWLTCRDQRGYKEDGDEVVNV